MSEPSEVIVIKALSRVLKNVPVFGAVPEKRPAKFVTVERVAGVRGRIVDRPTFAIQAWAETKNLAAQLATKVSDAFTELPVTVPSMGKARVVSIYSFPDPESRAARFQLTANAVFII